MMDAKLNQGTCENIRRDFDWNYSIFPTENIIEI